MTHIRVSSNRVWEKLHGRKKFVPVLGQTFARPLALIGLRLNCLVRITGSGFSMVTHVPALKKLDLQGCLYVKDQFFAPFTKLVPNLSSIVFGDNQRITDSAISAMATNCNKLEVVRFEGMIYVSDESISL